MALHLKLRPQTLTNLRRLSSSSTPQSQTPPPESCENDDAAPQPPPLSSYFSDIKERLRSPHSPPRRIPDTPPPPHPLSSSAAPKPAFLEEIGHHLTEFRLRSGSPPPPSASSSALCFEELLKNNVPVKSGGDPTDRHSVDSIRESLRQFRATRTKEYQTPQSSFMLKRFQEKLRSETEERDSPILEKLPNSLFGREMREKKGEGELKHMYSFNEMRAEMRKVRQERTTKDGNEQLVKLRELEMEAETRMDDITFEDLHNGLARLNEVDANRKANMQNLSISTNFGEGKLHPPSFILKPPQEQLLEKNFYPDHMSSAEKMKLKEVRDEFKMSESNCGSAHVQVTESLCKMSTSRMKKSKRMTSPDTTSPPSSTETSSIPDQLSTEFSHLNRDMDATENVSDEVGKQFESATKGLNKFKASIRDRENDNQVHAKEMRLSHVCQEATLLACLSRHSEEGYRIAIDAIREAAKKISAIEHITNNNSEVPIISSKGNNDPMPSQFLLDPNISETEEGRELNNDGIDNMSIELAQEKNKRKCRVCKGQGHDKRNCPLNPKIKKPNMEASDTEEIEELSD